MQATRYIRYNQLMPSQASQLPHLMEFSLQDQVGYQAASHNFTEFGHQTTVLCFSVGAGLPAMQATRYIRHNQLMPSQASQPPHLVEISFQSGRLPGRLPQFYRVRPPDESALLFCGSWLACDAGTLVSQVHRVDAIAGKPAPTFG